MKLSSVVTSRLMPGWAVRKRPMIGGSTRRATAVGTLSRSVPVGRIAKAVDRVERGGDLA